MTKPAASESGSANGDRPAPARRAHDDAGRAEQQARLSKALRENLKKRKKQARGRTAARGSSGNGT